MMRDLQKTIGYQFKNLSLLENAALPLSAQGILKKEREQKAAAVLTKLGLGQILHARPSQVTVRQREQVLLAQKILLNGEEQ